jgi:hypothetical protein
MALCAASTQRAAVAAGSRTRPLGSTLLLIAVKSDFKFLASSRGLFGGGQQQFYSLKALA